ARSLFLLSHSLIFMHSLATALLVAALLGVADAVSCQNCNGNGEMCTGTTCQGNYCFRELIKQQNGMMNVVRGCAMSNFLIFPDQTRTTLINDCERKMINGAEYSFEVCNNGDLCDTHCASQPSVAPLPYVSCQSCRANNAETCTGNICQGNYCIYERTKQPNGAMSVERGCALTSYALYPDNSRTTLNNQCEKKIINGNEYSFEICNTGDYCDTHCNGSTSLSIILSLFLLPVAYLFKH
ncbi:hypothetical protein PFISCL1PPCAC_6996, partial [Pristionchus fissidentatus]